MYRLNVVLVAIGLALISVAPVAAQAMPALRIGQKADLGRFVTDGQGRSLYEFRRDTGTVSACVDACLTTWPPLVQAAGQPVLAPGLGGTVGVAVQADGRRQVTYNGKLLYYFRMDVNAGDTAGQGVGGNWYVVEAVAAAAALPRTGGPVGLTWLASLAGLGVLGAGVATRRLRRRS